MLRSKIEMLIPITGIMIQDNFSPIVAPILAECGFDFVVVDQEHAPSSYQDLQNLILATKNIDISVLVRPPTISYEHIAKYLDIGCDGLMVPHVDDAQEARNVVDWAKYPPLGHRGYGMRRILSRFHNNEAKSDYIKQANRKTVIFVQIESEQSAETSKKILQLDGIDGAVVGPADFTMSLGVIGQYEDSKFEKLVQTVLNNCKETKKMFGIHLSDMQILQKWRKLGMNILMYSSVSGLIRERARDVLSKLKNRVPMEGAESDIY